MSDALSIRNIFIWALMMIFIAIGIMNAVLVHVVPGIFYLAISLLYCPPLATHVSHKFGLSIPYLVKIILAFLILWGTLAVGDLAEMYGL